MKCVDFINEYNAANDKKKCVTRHITRKYLPYETKIALSEKIIETSMFKMVNDKKIFYPNTPVRYLFFVMAIIQNYTDIEFNDGNNDTMASQNLETYNMLQENDAIDNIMSVIGTEGKQFNIVLSMILNDTMDRERNLIPYLDTKIEAWRLGMNVLGDAIANRVEEESRE